MKKNYVLLLLLSFSITSVFAQIEGTWKLAPQAAAMGVGPGMGNIDWWSNSEADVTTRACLFDDKYVFNADGSFKNEMDGDTWIETWQGAAAEGCAAPVAPHDGSAIATWAYDATAGTVTLTGKGAFLGLAKVYNTGELTNPDDAPVSITYPVTLDATGNTMTIDINYGGDGWWKFVMAKEATPVAATPEGTWRMAPEAGALGVGPGEGNIDWWSNSSDDVATRACFFDDRYVFNADGSFQNQLDGDSWIEPWQGVEAEGCGTPVAPHDGSAIATWSFDEAAGTVTLSGKGAYLGLPKVFNTGELTAPDDAPASIAYPVAFSADGLTMTIDMNYGGDGWWHFVLSKDVVTGNVKAFDKDLFKVYPNPASSEITINSTEKLSEVKIYDMTGKEVYTSSDVNLIETINVSALTRGIYTVSVTSENKRSVSKLILN